jgi:outer membrane receptor protein involved in Fe transport
MKGCLSLFVFVVCVVQAKAQVEREEPPVGNNPTIRIQEQRFYGKVVDSRTNQGMPSATVQLFALRPSDSLVSTQLTRANGDFNFTRLPQADSFKVVISGIGYTAWSRTVVPTPNAATDLGNITLEQQVTTLGNVVVTAQRPALQMGIDRKVFSVDQNITATGGTALDVMRNIPSVSVDVEGTVQLRNSEPQIFVDGRPTILTPDQIPADQIERIELITNPSARFDAASSGGIINIVMKRNRRVGLNGVATVGAGHPNIYNGNLTLNVRQGKWNIFGSGSLNQQGGIAKGKTFRQNRENGVLQNYFNQYAENEARRRFASARVGVDFFATNRTTISLTQNIAGGNFRNEETQDQEYLNAGKQLERYGDRFSESRSEFNRNNTQLNFTQKFPQPGRELTANINYNYGKGNDGTDILNRFFLPNGTPYSDPARVRNAGRNTNDQYTLQVDYVMPRGEEGKWEAGIRSNINEQESFFSSFSVANGIETRLPLSNDYTFKETVHAAYGSWSDKVKTFSYQLGLRAEVSSFEGRLLGSDKSFGYDYPASARRFYDALFPSVFLTKEVGDDVQVQVNYTRRIRRPNFWQLNPFIDINDPVNLRQGNPNLQPEFINSFEANYSHDYTKGNFLGVIYYRNNQRDITRYSDTISTALYQQLNNAAIDPNAILNTFINARSTNSLGLELTLQHQFNQQFSITPTIDMQYRQVNADVDALRLSNNGFNWDAELTMNYKFNQAKGLGKDLGLQLVGEYESQEVTAQGRNRAEYQVDFGLRKEFLKDKKGAFSFNINDIFNTQRFVSILDTETFYQEAFRRRNVRSFRVSFTYRFGQDNFNIFRREERDRDEE